MSTATVTEVIGSHCDHRDCTAPVRVAARFTTGELVFCMHHWVAVEDRVVETPSFVSAAPTGGEPGD